MSTDSPESRNILFVSSTSDFYGAERSLLEVVKRMGPPWRAHFLVPGPGRFTDALSQANFPVYRLNLEIKPRAPWRLRRVPVIFRLARLIWARRIHLVHLNLHFDAPVVAAACAITGVPLVVHVRNMITRPVDLLFRKVDGIICISQAVRKSLISEARLSLPAFARRLWVIPDGRDVSSYGRGKRNAIRKEFGLDDHTPLVGMVARITPMKGQDIFLQMAALVSEKLPSAQFLLVGGPCAPAEADYMLKLQHLQKELRLGDRVIFTGYREDIPDILAAMDCFVHPSRRGAFVSVLIEAMASGVPIVASDVDGIPECVGRAGAAMLISPMTAVACADGVIRILSDKQLAANMAAIGRERAQRLYDISRLAGDTTCVFHALCKG